MSAQPLRSPYPSKTAGGYRSPEHLATPATVQWHTSLPAIWNFPRSTQIWWAGSVLFFLLALSVAGTARALERTRVMELRQLEKTLAETRAETLRLEREYRNLLRTRNDQALLSAGAASRIPAGLPLEISADPLPHGLASAHRQGQ
ncbi:MAG: hypothetical protein GEEBNDBF_00850 [bacterium]|nr:hypothetical protein [bacterium]